MTVFSHSTSLSHSTSNDTRFDEFMSNVRQFGRDAADGKDALPKLAIAVVRAAADGVIDLTKGADGRDAAATIYEEYCKSESKKAIHEHSAGGTKANASKLRQLVTFGCNPKFDGVDVLNKAIVIRQKYNADADLRKELKPTYASFVDLAREQNALDDAMDDSEIEAVMRKNPPKDTTLEQELKAIHKKVEKLISGDNKAGVKDQSSELIQAEELLRTRLAALLEKNARDELLAKAAALGIQLAEAA